MNKYIQDEIRNNSRLLLKGRKISYFIYETSIETASTQNQTSAQSTKSLLIQADEKTGAFLE